MCLRLSVLALDLVNFQVNPYYPSDSPVTREVPVCLCLSFSTNEIKITTFEGTFSEEVRKDRSVKNEELGFRPYDK